MIVRAGALTAALAVFCTAGAMARSRSAELHLVASVKADCSIDAPASLDLGTYVSGQNQPLKTQSKLLMIACTKGAPDVHVILSEGRHFLDGHRHLRGPAPGNRKIEYEIYVGPKYKEVWNPVHPVTYKPKSDKPFALTLYGKVFKNQKVPPGEYHDHLIATVEF
jgi:spore coat protein U-like protein